MDSALHRASALRGYGRHPSGSYLYAGLPDNLRGTDHLYFPVFFNLTSRLSYRQLVLLIAGFSFVVCNQGLNVILSISVPVLDAIYPISIMLIVLGLCDTKLGHIPFIYPCTIGSVDS